MINSATIVHACGIAACLFVVLDVNLAASEDAASNGDPAADADAPKSKLAATYEAVPRSIQKHIYLRFNDEGEISQRRQHLRAQFLVVLDADVELLAYRVENATVQAFTDEPLKVTQTHPDHWQTVRTRGRRDQNRSLSINFTAEPPPRSALALKSVSGDLHLRIGHPPIEEIEIGPFAKIKGEEREVPGMPDAHVKIDQLKKRMRVTLWGKGWRSLEELQFQNANGNVFQTMNHNVGLRASHNRYAHTLNGEMPEKGKLVIRRWSEVSVHKARLEATDVPLPAAFSDDAVELSRAHPDEATLPEPVVALRE
jgi:hypothetical protein